MPPTERGVNITIKNFDELNLIDNYLMNAMASNAEVGPKCLKKILSVLLQREIGEVKLIAEKIIPGSMPNLRGIRMDVEVTEITNDSVTNIYDVEPHTYKDIQQLPKRNRFYQAKIDSKELKSGNNDFTSLPNLYVITITNFDVFGYGHVQYSISNKCDEVPELIYDDGVKFIYFNTSGSIGGTKEIKSMLEYIANSDEKHMVDDATNEIGEYVKYIKEAPEVRSGFMTYGEYFDILVEDIKKDAQREVEEANQRTKEANQRNKEIEEENKRLKELLLQNNITI